MLSTEMAPSNSSVHPVRGVKLKVIKKPTPFGMSFSILYGVPSYRDVVNAVFAWSKKLSPRLGSGYFMWSTEIAPGNSSIHPVRGVKLSRML